MDSNAHSLIEETMRAFSHTMAGKGLDDFKTIWTSGCSSSNLTPDNQFRVAQNCRGSQSSETLGFSGLFGVWNPHQSTHLYINITGITQCPHCQTSFCPPLKISFQSCFSMFDNISDVMISFSNSGGRHFTVIHMRTYLVFVAPPRFCLLLQAKLHIPANLPTGNATVHLPK